VGHAQFPRALSQGQPPSSRSGSRRWHPCCRLCLLKGCERWFLAQRPQTRYCSSACQQAARRWRRWHASQRYRATTHRKQHRRDQARRYRSRRQHRSTSPEPEPPPGQSAPQPPRSTSPEGSSGSKAPRGQGSAEPFLLITACSTSACIRATATDAKSYRFHPIIVRECVGDRSPVAHEWTLFRHPGAVRRRRATGRGPCLRIELGGAMIAR
jgi:Isochorismatase family